MVRAEAGMQIRQAIDVSVRNYSVFSKEDGRANGAKWINLGCVLGINPTGLLMDLKWNVKETEIKNDCRFLA